MKPGFSETKRKETSIFSGNYFFYFLVLGIYFPYFTLYCHDIGFSERQVGMIAGLRTAASILFPLGWALLVDRFHLHRAVFLACHAMAALSWCAFFLTESFLFMMLIMGLYGFFHSPLIGFMEAFTVHFLGGKKEGYGGIRLWGSVGFIAAVWTGGVLLDLWSSRMVLWLVAAGSLAGIWVASRTPAQEGQRFTLSRSGLRRLLSGNGMLFLFLAFVMQMSHGAYYGFFSIHLSRAGFSGGFIGSAWALASLAEIAVMMGFHQLFRYFSLKKLMIFSFFIAVCRWGLLAFFLHPALILLAQMLHAFTYGLFHIATILFMDFLVDSGAKTMGQTVLNATSYGLGLMAGYLLSGAGFAVWGEGMFLASAAMALTGGLCALGLQGPDGVRTLGNG